MDGLQSAESDEFGRNIGEVMRMRREQRRYAVQWSVLQWYHGTSEWCSCRALRAAKRKAKPNPNPLEHEVDYP